jgi:hypothetical protein
MDPSGHPKSVSRPVTVAFAPGSSPDTKTLLAGSVAGSVMTAIAAVFMVLTTCVSGSAAWSFSARLEFG